jgi:hypothetical protein
MDTLYVVCFARWQPDSKFPYSQVRLPPKADPKVEFTENMEVEVYSRANHQEAYGWWKSRIKVSAFWEVHDCVRINIVYLSRDVISTADI